MGIYAIFYVNKGALLFRKHICWGNRPVSEHDGLSSSVQEGKKGSVFHGVNCNGEVVTVYIRP